MKITFVMDSQVLFKYCGVGGLDALQSLRLKVTPPNEFNDPFEFMPQLEVAFPRREVVKRLSSKGILRKAWLPARREVSFDAFLRDYAEMLHASGGYKIRRTVKMLHAYADQAREEIVDFWSRRYGIICYSEVPDDILMWAHYADSHRGLVLAFDANHDFFRKSRNLMPVLYRSERVAGRFDFRGLRFSEEIHNLMRSKSQHWSYERELRQVISLRKCSKKPQTNAPGYLHFHKIPPKLVHQVILGFRATSETEKAARAALSASSLRHVRLLRAVLHKRDFRLQLIDA